MKETQYFYNATPNTIGQNVWKLGNDKFSCSRHTARAARFRQLFQDIRARFDNNGNTLSGSFVFFRDSL